MQIKCISDSVWQCHTGICYTANCPTPLMVQVNHSNISDGTTPCSHHTVPSQIHLVICTHSISGIFPPLRYNFSTFTSSISEMAQYYLYQSIPLNEVLVPFDHEQCILDLVYGLCWSSWQWCRDHNQYYLFAWPH